MAISTGLRRLHIVLLCVTGLWALVFTLAALFDSEGSDRWVMIGIGATPLVLYLAAAWIVAGFVQTRDSAGTALKTGEAAEVPVPLMKLATAWPRFWARWFDLITLSTLVGLALGLLFPPLANAPIFTGSGGTVLFGILILPVVMLLDACVGATFGSTLGQKLAGVRVTMLDGTTPKFATLRKRNFGVLAHGLAFGVPLFNLFTLSTSRTTLDRGQLLVWDQDTDTRCFDVAASTLRLAAVALVAASLYIGFTIFNALAQREGPGEITSALSSESLAEIAAREGSGTPYLVDKDTRIDRVSAPDDRQLLYEYTLVNVHEASHDMDAVRQAIDVTVRSSIMQAVCSNAYSVAVLDRGTVFTYRYKDSDGGHVTNLELRRTDCKD